MRALRPSEELIMCQLCGDEFIARKSENRKYCHAECFQMDYGNIAKKRRNTFVERGRAEMLKDVTNVLLLHKEPIHPQDLIKDLLLRFGGNK